MFLFRKELEREDLSSGEDSEGTVSKEEDTLTAVELFSCEEHYSKQCPVWIWNILVNNVKNKAK